MRYFTVDTIHCSSPSISSCEIGKVGLSPSSAVVLEVALLGYSLVQGLHMPQALAK